MTSAQQQDDDRAVAVIVQRAIARFQKWRNERLVATDHLFAKVLVGEWLFGIAVALIFSPYAWTGKTRVLHAHVLFAVLLGALIIAAPLLLIWRRPGSVLTRHVVAAGQMLYSALLIHLTGGRIETHFHVFGSVAILAFYLDVWVLVTATVTVAIDHLLRGVLWPESVYGIVNPEWWRFLEHAFWVVFCVGFLARHAVVTLKSWLAFAEEGGMLEALSESEWRNSSVLERAAQPDVPLTGDGPPAR